jgi:hypothetical protein
MTPTWPVLLWIALPLVALFAISLCRAAGRAEVVAERLPVARATRSQVRRWRRERLVLPGNRRRT